MRVNLRRGQVGVTEHGLNEADVGATFEHQRGHGVTEEMARAALAEIGGIDPEARQVREMVGRQPFARARKEHHVIPPHQPPKAGSST